MLGASTMTRCPTSPKGLSYLAFVERRGARPGRTPRHHVRARLWRRRGGALGTSNKFDKRFEISITEHAGKP